MSIRLSSARSGAFVLRRNRIAVGPHSLACVRRIARTDAAARKAAHGFTPARLRSLGALNGCTFVLDVKVGPWGG
jgi:hypothetical protein